MLAAQYDLGTLYATGTGTDANAFEAAKWIGKAAAAGHAEAQLDYAVILFQGRGVPPDPKRGADCFGRPRRRAWRWRRTGWRAAMRMAPACRWTWWRPPSGT